jgi:hypothetical protein
MQDANWGHCNHCKHFGSPAKAPLGGEEAGCNEPRLSKFQLRVFGACGCNRFMLRPGFTQAAESPPMRSQV